MVKDPLLVHLVAIPLAAWGHMRPLISLLINLTHLHANLRITILSIPSLLTRIHTELNRKYSPPREGVVRVLSVGQEDKGIWDPREMLEQALDLGGKLPPVLEGLLNDGDGWGSPKVFIYDAFQVGFVPALEKTLAGCEAEIKRPRLLAFFPSNVSWAYNCWCSSEEGSDLGRAIVHTDKLKAERGLSEEEAMCEAYSTKVGFVVDTPGLEPMYDWEQYPQLGSLHVPPQFMAMRRPLYSQKALCDGFVFPWDPEMEFEVIEAFERSIGMRCHAVGMQFSDEVWDGKKPVSKEEDRAVVDWLDRQHAGSVLYISFGSLCWPVLRPDLLVHLIASLIEADIPFLFPHASKFADLSEELRCLIKSYGDKAMIAEFAPQEAVLAHPSVHFFLSHMGSNSIGESVIAGKPMIAWPFMGDQPELTQQMVKRGCAIELKQVRTSGIGKETYSGVMIYNTPEAIRSEMRDVWSRISGEEGKEMMKNVVKLRRELYDSCRSGRARQAMLDLRKTWQ